MGREQSGFSGRIGGVYAAFGYLSLPGVGSPYSLVFAWVTQGSDFCPVVRSGARWATGRVGQISAREAAAAAQVKSVLPGEAIVLGSDPETLAVANAWKAEAGYQDVIAHGTMDSTGKFVFIVDGKALTAEELARMIRSDPNYKGDAVRLLSCNSGCGETPGAEALAKALGVPVKAPVGKPGAYQGSPYVYEPGPPGYPKIPQNPQRWVVCQPGGGCK